MADIDKLRAFAQAVLGDWPESFPDGFDIQDLAEKHGLLKLKCPKPTTPCDPDRCKCADYFDERDWAVGVDCFERAPLLLGSAYGNGVCESQNGSRADVTRNGEA